MNDKLKNFPITVFAIVMGLTGFTIALNKFYHLDWLPKIFYEIMLFVVCLLYTSPSPRDRTRSRMPSSA